MSTRWFYSFARDGASIGATSGGGLPTEVSFERSVGGTTTPFPVSGPTLRLTTAGDVAAIDRGLIIREQPAPGTLDAAENIMASVEFAHADLPWLLSTETVASRNGDVVHPVPWLLLVVLSTDEAGPPVDADPVPLLTAAATVLPPLGESWAWAHVEARLDETEPAQAKLRASEGVRHRSASVVARLVCPRKLDHGNAWIAAVVPRPTSGRWSPLADGTCILPVFHWWTFRTGPPGTFEGLARRLEKVTAAEVGVGTRTIDVSTPWPPAPGDPPAAGLVTVTLDGAMRAPGTDDFEAFSDHDAEHAFRDRLVAELNLPGDRHAPDRTVDPTATAVGPPLYGGHHVGATRVDPDSGSWVTTLNIEVRRRVAAALGACYVQSEQEFLMERAWEQVGEIREANRLLAVAELAAEASGALQRKHIAPQSAADRLVTFAPMAGRVVALRSLVAGGQVTDGVATTAYARLTRTGGALARRMGRVSGTTVSTQTMVGAMPTEAAPTMQLLAERTAPVPLQVLRMAAMLDVAGSLALGDRGRDGDARSLGPIMKHPNFDVPIAMEILSRWPDWALPGISGLPMNSVMVLETNPGFVAALMVGLNHEFNAELLWREFPTDQRGTAFRRFWPTAGFDIAEIATWPDDSSLESQVAGGEEGSIVLVIRGEVLSRFPATTLLAVRGEPVPGTDPPKFVLPKTFTGTPGTPLPLDESTVLFMFSGISESDVRTEGWFFVLREPMRGTQFGFDLEATSDDFTSWSDLLWDDVTRDAAGYVRLNTPLRQPNPSGGDPATWGRDAADMARIAYQRQFQLAFRASDWLSR